MEGGRQRRQVVFTTFMCRNGEKWDGKEVEQKKRKRGAAWREGTGD